MLSSVSGLTNYSISSINGYKQNIPNSLKYGALGIDFIINTMTSINRFPKLPTETLFIYSTGTMLGSSIRCGFIYCLGNFMGKGFRHITTNSNPPPLQ
jgi:hypothetical protein